MAFERKALDAGIDMPRPIAAYASAGGDLTWAGPDLFVSVIRNHLQVLSEHLRVALGEAPAARS
ncbi:hypothetical protein [Kribbella solani]|uniref:Uncharacterized protein n=1 Tax=Kribbella solani TaxID=236067 RepID=A0A841DV41_9ACTN|nr:hypothetical protein [Kribbella solani]MBB5981821.1 hypothetical protein [Kribbella solani]